MYLCRMEHLYDWIFNYNPYKKEWRAVKREDYSLLFSAINSNQIIRSSDLNTLVEIISATNGDTTKLKNLIIEK